MKSIWLFSIFRLFELLLNFKEAGISFHKVKTVNLYHVATTGLTDFAFSTELRLPSFEIEIWKWNQFGARNLISAPHCRHRRLKPRLDESWIWKIKRSQISHIINVHTDMCGHKFAYISLAFIYWMELKSKMKFHTEKNCSTVNRLKNNWRNGIPHTTLHYIWFKIVYVYLSDSIEQNK